MPRRRRRSTIKRDSYEKDQCSKCGQPAIPPTAARYCKEHMPTERECMNCGDKFPWHFRGSGLCSKCYRIDVAIMKEHIDNDNGRLDPNWSAGDQLRELAERTTVREW